MSFIKNISIFSLFVFIGCNGSGGGGATGGADVKRNAITGFLTYDSVPIQDSIGLNYAATTQKPMRKIYLEAIDSNTDLAITSASTNNSGEFTLNVPVTYTSIYLRVYSV